MPIAWTLDPGSRLVRFEWRDPYTFDEWRDAISTLLAHRACSSGFRFLVDRRRATAPSTMFISQMASFFELHRDAVAGGRAAVIASDDAGFGMARMTELMMTGRVPTMSIRVFREVAAGEQWLLGSLAESP